MVETSRKKRRRGAPLPDSEAMYEQLIQEYNTVLATQPLAVTPMKRKGRAMEEVSSPDTETAARRKVVFNLKLNKTQHFGQEDIVAGSDLQERLAGLTPTKSLLKVSQAAPQEKQKRRKRKAV